MVAMNKFSSYIAYDGEGEHKTVDDNIEFDDEPQIGQLF